MKLLTHSGPFIIDSINDTGHFQGAGAIYNNIAFAKRLDVLVPGSMSRTIQHWKQSGKRMPFLYQHDHKQIIGSLVPSESQRGLEVSGQFALGTQLGKECYELVKNHGVGGLSIGFDEIPSKTELRTTEHGVVAFLKEIRLHEVSLVTWPADSECQIEAVHQEEENWSDEKKQWMNDTIPVLMTHGGKSKTEAEIIAIYLWDTVKGKKERREEVFTSATAAKLLAETASAMSWRKK